MPRITLPGTLEVSMPRARNDQGDVGRDKRPKYSHQRRNTVPEFVQIQSQHNLNFAGPHQGVSRPVVTRTLPACTPRNPIVSVSRIPRKKQNHAET